MTNKVTRRTILLWMMNLFGFSILVLRFGYLQFLKSSEFSFLSDRNRIRNFTHPGIRGRIFDINGKVIANSEPAYFLFLKRDYKSELEAIRARISAIFNGEDLLIGASNYIDDRNKDILVGGHLSRARVASILSDIELVNKIDVQKVIKRVYPYGMVAFNITGYVAKGGDKTISFVGQSGIERFYNGEIIGDPSVVRSEFDALGNRKRTIEEMHQAPGADLQLSIDIDLQKALNKQLINKKGSIVVIKAADGALAALATSPGYDPNAFASGMRGELWQSLISDERKPLLDRSISVSYPPGSSFKLITALAILRKGVDIEAEFECTGSHQVGDRVFRCARKSGHGMVNFTRALACSCNVYFYKMAKIINGEDLYAAASDAGIVGRLGVDLPFEAAGLIPNAEWKYQHIGESWKMGDTVNTSIGQGYTLMTPLQIAVMALSIATGKRAKPKLRAGRSIIEKAPIEERYLQAIRSGMAESFISDCGTCRRMRHIFDQNGLIGKTGSAQIMAADASSVSINTSHSIFAGAFPYDNPKYAISVVIEEGGWGSRSALTAAAKIAQFLGV